MSAITAQLARDGPVFERSRRVNSRGIVSSMALQHHESIVSTSISISIVIVIPSVVEPPNTPSQCACPTIRVVITCHLPPAAPSESPCNCSLFLREQQGFVSVRPIHTSTIHPHLLRVYSSHRSLFHARHRSVQSSASAAPLTHHRQIHRLLGNSIDGRRAHSTISPCVCLNFRLPQLHPLPPISPSRPIMHPPPSTC